MSIDEVIRAATDTVVSVKEIEELKSRLADDEMKYEAEQRRSSAANEFLSRTYSL